MGIFIQKFGGTSLGSGERLATVAGIVSQFHAHSPVIAVVSAMSSSDKSNGTTSLLLRASELALRGESFDEPLERIAAMHREAIDTALTSPERQQALGELLQREITRLRGFLDAIDVIRELSPRSVDLLIATGERLSAHLLSGTLIDRGVASRVVDLTHAAPESTSPENGLPPSDPMYFRNLQPKLAELCAPQDREVPVVTGFIGLIPGGLLNSIGRGYTDFTAALISAGLGRERAEEMQVWKEVDGIFTADPRRVPNARVLPSITPLEASELTYFGSEVLHPFTMERVTAARIPIRIKNTFSPQNPGTVILDDAEKGSMAVTAVTAKSGITIFSVLSNHMYNAYGFLSGVFNVLNEHGVVVDLVSTSEVSISCTAERSDTVYRARADLEKLGEVSILHDRTILAMVGSGMKYAVGTAGKMFNALAESGINIEMISQGASEINISCVIKAQDTEAGLRAVHKAFLEDA